MSFIRCLRSTALRPTWSVAAVPQQRFISVAAPSSSSAVVTTTAARPLTFPYVNSIFNRLINELADGIMLLKRTFQPSLMRRKRKHGFLSRLNDRNGKKVLNRRLEKGRRQLSA